MLPVVLPIWNRFLTCTMLNRRRQWDWRKVSNFGNNQQHVCDFLSSVTKHHWSVGRGHSECLEYGKTICCPGIRPAPCWRIQRSPRPCSWWGWGWLPLSKNATPTLGPSDLATRLFGSRNSTLRASIHVSPKLKSWIFPCYGLLYWISVVLLEWTDKYRYAKWMSKAIVHVCKCSLPRIGNHCNQCI